MPRIAITPATGNYSSSGPITTGNPETMPEDGWITAVACRVGGELGSVIGRLVVYEGEGATAVRRFVSAGQTWGQGAAERSAVVPNVALARSARFLWGFGVSGSGGSNGNGIDFGYREIATRRRLTHRAFPPPNPFGTPDDSVFSIVGYVDYEPNRAPTFGVFTSPADGQPVSTVDVAIGGTTPHGGGDGAYDHTKEVQLQVFDADTAAQVFDETFATTQAQKDAKAFSRSVGSPAVVPGKRYYARFRHKDSFGVWSTFSADRHFTMTQGPNPPTPAEPSGLLDALSGFSYKMQHNHPEGRPASSVEVELQSSGGAVLWSSTAAVDAAAGSQIVVAASGGTQPGGAAGHPALVWGTGYGWRARATDSLGAQGPWCPLAAFRTNSTPNAPANVSPPANSVTGGRTVRVDVSDPDGDAVTGVEAELVRVSTGAVVPGYPKAMAIHPSGAYATLELAAADAVAGQQYRYRARATDGKASGYGPWSGYTTFTFVTAAAVSLLSPPQAGRANLIPDPSFEYEPGEAAPYWTAEGATGGSTFARERDEDSAFGEWRGRLRKAAGTPSLALVGKKHPVDETKNWRPRLSAKKVLPVDANGDFGPGTPTTATFALRCYNASGTLLGTVTPNGDGGGHLLGMASRNLDPFWRGYGGVVRPVGTTGSARPVLPAGTTHVAPVVTLSGTGGQDVAVDAFVLEEVPAAPDADWARLAGFYGYLDPDLPAQAPGGYSPGGAYGGTVGSRAGEPGDSQDSVLGALDTADKNSVFVSYSHAVAKTHDRVVVERLKPDGGWERHHESAWGGGARTVVPLPDHLFRNQRRYRVRVEVRDANNIEARTDAVEFPVRYQGPPELAVLSHSDDPIRGTVTLNFVPSGLPNPEFGGIEIARECEETGEELRTVALLTDPAATSYTYHFPVSGRAYRYHVRQVRLVGPERVEGQYRSIEASVDSPYDFLKLARDPTVLVAFEHAADAGPAFGRQAPNEGYQPWGALAPVHLFGEGRARGGSTSFLLYNDPDLPAPAERLEALRQMERERGTLCLLTLNPAPEKTFVALTGDVVFTNRERLIAADLDWTQQGYVENAYDILGAYDAEFG